MAANTRPYLCIFNGKAHMVDAKDPGAVVRHIVGAAVTELRPAHAREVAQWARENKPIEIAGVTAPAADDDGVIRHPTGRVETVTLQNDDVEFTVEDAWEWFDAQMGVGNGEVLTPQQEKAIWALKDAIKSGQMDLMQFDDARQGIPGFGDAIARHLSPAGDVDAVRGMIEAQPLLIGVVVDAVGDQKRSEMFEPDQSEADITGESLG